MNEQLQQLIVGIEALIKTQTDGNRLQETTLELRAAQGNENKVQTEALASLLMDLKQITATGNEAIIAVLKTHTDALAEIADFKSSIDALVSRETEPKETVDENLPVIEAITKVNDTLLLLLEESKKEEKTPEIQKVEITNFPPEKENEGPEEVIVTNEIQVAKPKWYEAFSYTKITESFKTMLGSLVFRIKPEEVIKVYVVDEKGQIISDFSPTIVNRGGGEKNGGGGGPSQVGLQDIAGKPVNPASKESLDAILAAINSSQLDTEDVSLQIQRLLQLLRPLGIVTGGGSNRLSIDINNIVGGTIGTVTALATLTNQANIGGVNAFTQQQAILRNAYAVGISNNLIFS